MATLSCPKQQHKTIPLQNWTTQRLSILEHFDLASGFADQMIEKI